MPADETSPIEELDEAECRLLLTTATVGHLGFTHGALPAIVPVPFALQDEHVIIPARRSNPMVAAVRGAVVAFEVDHFDPHTETGWSVTVIGASRVTGDRDQVAPFEAIRSPQVLTGHDRCFICIRPGLLRGWRASARDVERTSAGTAAEDAPPG